MYSAGSVGSSCSGCVIGCFSEQNLWMRAVMHVSEKCLVGAGGELSAARRVRQKEERVGMQAGQARLLSRAPAQGSRLPRTSDKNSSPDATACPSQFTIHSPRTSSRLRRRLDGARKQWMTTTRAHQRLSTIIYKCRGPCVRRAMTKPAPARMPGVFVVDRRGGTGCR
jgi:predicted NUDIX family NTP pyrophosphohydrolase